MPTNPDPAPAVPRFHGDDLPKCVVCGHEAGYHLQHRAPCFFGDGECDCLGYVAPAAGPPREALEKVNELPPAPCPITPLTVLDPDALLHWATAAVFGEKVPADVQDEPLIQAIQRLREAGRMDPPLEKCPECGFGREFICGDCGFSWQPRAAVPQDGEEKGQ